MAREDIYKMTRTLSRGISRARGRAQRDYQVPLPTQFTRLGYALSQLCSQRIYISSERPVSDLIDCSQPTEGAIAR